MVILHQHPVPAFAKSLLHDCLLLLCLSETEGLNLSAVLLPCDEYS